MPDWGGAQAGLPGMAFAKVLRDVQSGQSPVVSYWKQALIVSDNRIPALGSDTSVYSFAAPAGTGSISITVDLWFRRSFQAVMDAKGWNEPDILMEEAQMIFATQPWWQQYLPIVVQDVWSSE